MNSNKTALLVAAGDAIGAGVARRFAMGGYAVCIARREPEKSAALVEELRAQGGDVRAVAVDARDEQSVVRLFNEVQSSMGGIDMCLFNGGANTRMPIEDTSTKLFHRVWELACQAAFVVGREAAKHMVPREHGSIFFTGATASVRGGAEYAAFASAKFALRGLAQALARELGPRNIHVAHLVIDGGVDSEAIRRILKARGGADAGERPADALLSTRSVAEAYWFLHHQSRDAWTHELDLRPSVEKW
jgi:NAD(P)-dependent dehydrogenase (short-subunit alcohol dehydrogenase family)